MNVLEKAIIITEKPSVARQFAAALGVSGSQDGYIENDRWVITWCVGHLVSLSYPEAYDPALKKWSMDTLPFLPETYRYEALKKTAKQYKIVKELLNRRDISVIYNAGVTPSPLQHTMLSRTRLMSAQLQTSLWASIFQGLFPANTAPRSTGD